MSIVTEYPIWLVIPCLGLAFLYAFFLYRKDSAFRELTKIKLRLLFGLRFILTFFLTFFLLFPLIKSFTNYVEKPIIIFAQDNSESIRLGNYGLFNLETYEQHVQSLLDRLSESYEVQTYNFGEQLTGDLDFSFTDKISDFSTLFDELKNRYTNRNVGALIFASDGIFNQGSNPTYLVSASKYPIYSIALGDSSIQKDIAIKDIQYNRLAFLGNLFPVQVQVQTHALAPCNLNLFVTNKGRKVASSVISVTKNVQSELVTLQLKAESTGLNHYTIEIEPVDGEVNVRNNTREIIVDILDTKQKILLLGASPHPDIGALQRALITNPNFDVKIEITDKFTQDVKKYNLVVLYQVPGVKNVAKDFLTELSKSGIPVLFIMGEASAYSQIGNYNYGAKVSPKSDRSDACQAFLNKQFNSFGVSDELKEMAESAPPLMCAFGDYKIEESSNVLFFQKYNGMKTDKPLISFASFKNTKYGFVFGEGLWRWRIHNYSKSADHVLFDEMINKIVQYLALKIQKDNFSVSAKRIFNENEQVILEAEYYNESFELINDPEVSLEITNEKGVVFPFSFSRTKNSYRLNAGTFPVGDYVYMAIAKSEEDSKTRSGKFSVIAIDVEAENTVADHNLLYKMASLTGGQMSYPDQLDDLDGIITANKDIVPVSYSEKQLTDMIANKWILVLLLLLGFTEWFLRKYFGSY